MAFRTITHTTPVTPVNEVNTDPAYDDNAVVSREHTANVAGRIVWFVADLLLILLAFRFFLALFGANPNNGFANFIYTASHPFVAPFFNLFNYTYQMAYSRFEIYTLAAMAVYAVIAWIIARIVTIDHW